MDIRLEWPWAQRSLPRRTNPSGGGTITNQLVIVGFGPRDHPEAGPGSSVSWGGPEGWSSALLNLLAATLLSFSLSFDDSVISRFTASETVTLPLYLAGAFQREISPQIQVLSTLVLLVSAAALVLASTRAKGACKGIGLAAIQ